MVGVARAGQTASYVARVYAPAASTMSLYGGAGSANTHALTVGWNTVRGVLLGGAQLAGRVINLTAAAGAMYVAWVRINQDPPVYSGVYTPALTSFNNVDDASSHECQYLRVGNVVTVSGRVNVTPNTDDQATIIGIALPIASNFGDLEDCAGTAFSDAVPGLGAYIRGDAASNLAIIVLNPTDTMGHRYYFHFTYQII